MAKRRERIIPKRGDYVKLRGRPQTGILKTKNDENGWCKVQWDEGVEAPKFTHIQELEVIDLPQ